MKIIQKTIYALLVFAMITGTTSCEDGFEELNQPYKDASISTTSIPGLFNGIARSATGQSAVLAVSLIYPYATQQGVQNTSVPYLNYAPGLWNNYYPALLNYKALLKKIGEQSNPEAFNNVKHMASVLIGARTLQMLDYYGDIPYSSAGNGEGGTEYYRPAYDKQADVYKSVLADLKAASDGIVESGAGQTNIGASDSFLANDLTAWKKFSNALRLRYAVRLYGKEQQLASEIITDIISGNKPLPASQDVSSLANLRKNNYGTWPSLITPAVDGDFTDRNWYAFRETSVSNIRMNTNVWKQMSSTDDPSGSGIFDPRIYVFFQTNNADKWVPQPQLGQSDGGTPYPNDDTKMRKPIGTDPNNKYAAFNFFMVYDFKAFPYLIITDSDVHFLKAEIYQRGMSVAKNIASAKTEYEAGIISSVNFWYGYTQNSDVWLTKPALPTVAQMTKFLTTPAVLYDGTNDTQALTKIATQAWLATIYQPEEAWAITRRTGLTPKAAGFTPAIVNKLPYPADEKTNNLANWAIATNGADEATQALTKVYWMP